MHRKNIEALASLEDPFQILAADASNKAGNPQRPS
jgi:hypothetical protein